MKQQMLEIYSGLIKENPYGKRGVKAVRKVQKKLDKALGFMADNLDNLQVIVLHDLLIFTLWRLLSTFTKENQIQLLKLYIEVLENTRPSEREQAVDLYDHLGGAGKWLEIWRRRWPYEVIRPY